MTTLTYHCQNEPDEDHLQVLRDPTQEFQEPATIVATAPDPRARQANKEGVHRRSAMPG